MTAHFPASEQALSEESSHESDQHTLTFPWIVLETEKETLT